MKFKQIKNDIMEAMQATKPKTAPYDTEAEVIRVEGSTAWVHIPGGVTETPVSLTIAAQSGDTVRVRVSGGGAWLVGNDTSPPTDDTTAEVAKTEATRAGMQAVEAVNKAEGAARIAGNTAQHFWFAEAGDDTGAHITEVTEEEFLADPENGGGNLLARSNGIAVRNGIAELATFGSSGAHFYDDIGGLQGAITRGDDTPTTQTVQDTLFTAIPTEGQQITHTIVGAPTSDITFEILIYGDTFGRTTLTFDAGTSDTQTYSITGEFACEVAYDKPNRLIVCNVTESDTAAIASSTFSVSYSTKYYSANAHFGLQTESSGPNSFACGRDTHATGYAAHAEGAHSTASGQASHTEGEYTKASGLHAHAEGFYTRASGDHSHAEGFYTQASGNHSHAGGNSTKASYADQTVIGRYNANKSGTIFEIGNGTSDAERANALMVTWNGELWLALDTTASTGSTDGDLYAAISEAGWISEVIV